MHRDRIFDLLALILIAGMSIVVAWVTFSGLASTASGTVQGVQVGGAIAGFLVTVSVLSGLYLQFRQSSGELRELRDRNEELQQKLIRGAPRPANFQTQVDERQRIVLATPENWLPREGTLFHFELSHDEMRPEDVIPAQFRLSHSPFPRGFQTQDDFYSEYKASIDAVDYVNDFTTEFVYLGGEQAAVKSLKVIATEFAVAKVKPDTLTGTLSYSFDNVTEEAYRRLSAASTAASSEGALEDHVSPIGRISAPTIEKAVMLQRLRVICYHTTLHRIFEFDFIDDVGDFTVSSALFNQLLTSVRFLT